ncbi:MAG TPA: peptidoglycan editing factor PgeF, partial [Tahibacter sp.]|nr:peptidoglycan editing factor PgeF [Tahibacter sp.]
MTTGGAATGVVVPDWDAPRGVRAVVTTRHLPGNSPSPHESFNLGSRCGDRPEFVLANRAALVDLASLPGEPVWLRQVHGIDVHAPSVSPAAGADEPVADAVYTRTPGVVCAVLTADCLPLVVASDDGREVAAIHAGWRGLAAGVIEAALARFEAPPARLRVWLGPAIGAASYEVGDEVRDAFVAHDPAAAQAFEPTRPGHWLCDLVALARQRLAAFGVVDVAGGGFDTLTDERFYSHRRNRPTGRFASLIWIEPVSIEPARPADAAS